MSNEKQTDDAIEKIDDLSGEVLILRSDGSICKGQAIKNTLIENDIAYSVIYTDEDGNTRRRLFRKGDLEAMQSDISRQLDIDSEWRRQQLGLRLGQTAGDAEQSEANLQRIKARLEGSIDSQTRHIPANESGAPEKQPDLAQTVEFLRGRIEQSMLPVPEGISHNLLAISLRVWGDKFLEQSAGGDGPLSESDAKRLVAIGSAMRNDKHYTVHNFFSLCREAQEIIDKIRV